MERFPVTESLVERGMSMEVVEPPHRLLFRDGFANEDGTPNTELAIGTVQVTIQDISGGKTRMSIEADSRPSRRWSSYSPWARRRA